MLTLSPLAIALQGIGFGPLAMAALGLLPEDDEPAVVPVSGGFSDAPWRWVPFQPIKPRRPKKRRDTDVLFLGR